MQKGHSREAADVRRMWVLKRKQFGAIIRGSRYLAESMFGIPLKVLLYNDLVGVVTSSHDKNGGHTILSFVAENPLLYANFMALSSVGSDCRLKFYIAEIRKSRFFVRKIADIFTFFAQTAKLMHIIRLVINSCSLFCLSSYTRSKCGFTPNRWAWSLPMTCQRWRSYHSIRSVIAENSQLHAKSTALPSIEPKLLPMEVLHCGNRKFRVFLRKILKNIFKILFTPRKKT